MIKKNCVVCGKEFEAKYSTKKYCSVRCKNKTSYQKNKEKRKEYDKRYWEKNKDKVKERRKGYFKKYRIKNKDKLSEKGKKDYEKNKEKILKRQKGQYQKGKQDFLLKYKFGKSCVICGWNKHPEILQFHHKEEEEKSFTIGNKRSTLLSKNYQKLMKEEVKKCILICPNCHSLLHLKEKNAL